MHTTAKFWKLLGGHSPPLPTHVGLPLCTNLCLSLAGAQPLPKAISNA